MQEIAIKAPKVSTLNSGAIDDFFREAKTAINFKHENILKCLGISYGTASELLINATRKNFLLKKTKRVSVSEGVQGLPWLIFEYMHYGDLGGILLANSGVTSFHNDKLPTLSKVPKYFSLCLTSQCL